MWECVPKFEVRVSKGGRDQLRGDLTTHCAACMQYEILRQRLSTHWRKCLSSDAASCKCLGRCLAVANGRPFSTPPGLGGNASSSFST
ncbi:hypothetical protein BDZ91DRAFT_99400 [Kalaharituber pfeilii]|nr:hypothetical protein BDZ91DRAFT_99400 [Kalaharituber pfeilii]